MWNCWPYVSIEFTLSAENCQREHGVVLEIADKPMDIIHACHGAVIDGDDQDSRQHSAHGRRPTRFYCDDFNRALIRRVSSDGRRTARLVVSVVVMVFLWRRLSTVGLSVGK